VRDGHRSSIARDASTIPEFDTSAQFSRRFGHCNVRSLHAINAGSSTCLSNDCSISSLSTGENLSYSQSYASATATAISAQSRNDLITGRYLQLGVEIKSCKRFRVISSALPDSSLSPSIAKKEVLIRRRTRRFISARVSPLAEAGFVSWSAACKRVHTFEFFLDALRMRPISSFLNRRYG